MWVVVSDPTKDRNVLVVNVTSIRAGVPHDPACVLNANDHPFVRHASYMRYADCQIQSNAELDNKLASGSIVLDDKVSDDVLLRIRKGAIESDFIPRGHAAFLESQNLC